MGNAPVALAGGSPITASSLSRAALQTGRVLILLTALYLLLALRSESNLLVSSLMTLAVALSAWFAFGRDSAIRPFLLFLLGFGLFAQLRTLADETGIPYQAAYAIDLEQAAFGGLPTHWLQEHLYQQGRLGVLEAAGWAVYLSHYFALHIVAFLIWRKQRERFPMFAVAAMLMLYAGLLVSFLVPTVPPWLAAESGQIGPVSRVVPELVAQVSSSAYESGTRVVGSNDVAAMPSLHTATAVLIALYARSAGRRLGGVAAAYAVCMGFTLVYFGEHYVVDVLAGVLLACVAWRAAERYCFRDPIAPTAYPPQSAVPAASAAERPYS